MQRIHYRAEWIWRYRGLSKLPFAGGPPNFSDEENRFIAFRKTVEIRGDVSAAPVHVSADGRYQLFVNGQRIGRGPARSSPARQCADPYDLAPFLRPGRNVIAALVHSYGRPTSWYELPRWEAARAFGCGGFFLQGDAVTTAGVVCLDTDNSWRFQNCDAWERETPGCSLGFVEVYDARRATTGWTESDFDDADWDAAEILRVPGRNFTGDVAPFPVLVERDIPPLFEEMCRPAALLSWGEVTNAPDDGPVGAQMMAEISGEPVHCQAHNLAGLIGDADPAQIVTDENHSITVLLDFATVVFGRVALALDGPAGATVDFAYGEQLQADGRLLINQGILGYDSVPQAHRTILREGVQSWEQFEPAGFRYLQVTFRHALRPLRILGLTLNATGYPLADRGRFACSDDLLNRIWQAGAHTLRLCMHDTHVDCPTREQRQWVGDAYVQSPVNFASFGDPSLTIRLLRQTAETQQPDGLTTASVVSDFAAKDFFNIPDFSLYWIQILDSVVLFTGDTALAAELYPAVVKAIAWFERHLDRDGLLAELPHWVFVDWAELDKRGQVTAVNAQFVATLRAVSRLAGMVGHPGDAGHFIALADSVADGINRLLWDEARGVYVDARWRGVQSRRVSQQSNAAVMAWGVAPAQRWPRILAAIMDEARLVLTRMGDSDPTLTAFDEESQIVMAQPFFCHHLHQALALAGEHPAMLDNIRRRWGPWIAQGESTVWELWKLGPAISTCHAWAATPTFDLSTHILGVAPDAPGFQRFRVAPHPAGLTWAEGVFPSPLGDIAVAWVQESDHFELSVTVPPGAEAEVVLPASPTSGGWPHVDVDDVSTRTQIQVLGAGSHRIVAST